MITKLDLKKDLKYLYNPSAKSVEEVEVPEFNFAMVDGCVKAGEKVADSVDFMDAMTALYGIAYTLKFNTKLRNVEPVDYPVMALEALWWVKGDEFEFGKVQDWFFTAMILQPGVVTRPMFEDALAQLKKKKPSPGLEKLRLEPFFEGRCVQVLHLGPYSAEPPTIEHMKSYMKEHNLVRNGHHHEIYLGDPRRAAPEKLRTILRQGVKEG
jgi:hypothetical protein